MKQVNWTFQLTDNIRGINLLSAYLNLVINYSSLIRLFGIT